MTPISTRQLRILQFIRDYFAENSYPPSVREIADHVGLASTSSAHRQLCQLERKGYLKRNPTRARAITVRLPGEAA